LLTLTRVAEERGLRCSVLRGTLEELRREVSLPCIIHWQQNHFMVVYKITEEAVFIANPARGLETASHEEFRQGWEVEGGADGRAEGIVVCIAPARR
jgi:ATP-binding cassette subfamily B protein